MVVVLQLLMKTHYLGIKEAINSHIFGIPVNRKPNHTHPMICVCSHFKYSKIVYNTLKSVVTKVLILNVCMDKCTYFVPK